jgi:DinB superfamily
VATIGRLEAIERLEDGHATIAGLLEGLDERQFVALGTIGGGEWSAKDLLGHLATWEELAVRSLREFREGTMPWVEQPEGVFSAPATGKVDAFNARMVARGRVMTPAEVRARSESVHAELLTALRELPDEDWDAKAFYPTPNNRRRHLSSLLASVLGAKNGPFRHDLDHVPDLETYVRSVRPS